MTSARADIRLAQRDDAPALAAHLSRDREAFAATEPSRSEDYFTAAGQVERVERYLGEHAAGRMWPGVVVVEDEVVGWATVSDIRRGPFLVGAVGYWVGTTHQGRGHAREALGRLLALMRDELGLHRAEASTSLDNVASHHVLRSQGFRAYGTTTSSFLTDGRWRDSLMWERVL
ncbi:GNAT family N-acetyltransferase [Knoellia sp. Soil729]|uniref:GNAT family N-acetyltransferase n=1 Tax=Knoellia sp. Soil729 TaxID=1736394 RepID=UPI0006F4D559|nr:GNAT family protein [Knoellia sp. Soil729]KRE42297.1 alanine acetyltransferase [Knoellia sp. Soil729]